METLFTVAEPRTKIHVLRRKLEQEGRMPAAERSPHAALRNLWAYQAIQRAIPGFGWRVCLTERGKQVVKFTGYPKINGNPPSLVKLAEWAFREPGDSEKVRFERLPKGILQALFPIIGKLGREKGEAFINFLISVPCSIPQFRVSSRIADWFEAAMNGLRTTVFASVRADFADNDSCSEAQRILASIPPLGAFVKERGLKVRVVVAVNDFCAHDHAVLQRSGLDSRKEFVEQAELIRRSVSDACANASLDGQTVLATEIVGNGESWLNLARYYARNRRIAELAGGLVLPAEYLEEALAVLGLGYRRRYGEEVEAFAVLQEQAAQATAIAKAACDTYTNCLILGAGHPLIGPFYHGFGNVLRPVVCLKKDGY